MSFFLAVDDSEILFEGQVRGLTNSWPCCGFTAHFMPCSPDRWVNRGVGGEKCLKFQVSQVKKQV